MTSSPADPEEEAANAEGEVIVIDDDPMVRGTVVAAFGAMGLRTRDFPAAQDFLDAPPPSRPACIVVDMRMPRITGLALLRTLRSVGDAPPVIVMTGFADVPLTAEIFRAGAFDFLTKPFSMNEVVDLATRAIDHDRREVAARRRDAAARERVAALSPRELEIAELLTRGLTSKQIARDLDISPRTVDHHRRNAMEKLDVRNAVELAAVLMSRGRGDR